MRAEHTIRKNERRSSHARNTDAFATQIFYPVDIALGRRLHPKAAPMNPAREFYIHALFERFQKIHHQMVRDIIPSKRQHILVIGPVALHEADLEPFFFEKSLFDRCENRRFAGKTDIAHADLVRFTYRLRIPAAPEEQPKKTQGKSENADTPLPLSPFAFHNSLIDTTLAPS